MKGRGAKDLLAFAWRVTDGRIAAVAFVTVAAALMETISLVMLIPIVASAAPEQSGSAASIPIIGDWVAANTLPLSILLLIFLGLIVVQALLMRAKALYNQAVMHDAGDRMRIDLFQTMGMARWDLLRRYRGSDLHHVLTEDSKRTIGAIGAGLRLFQSLVMLAIMLFVAALISWQMTVFAVGVGGALFAALYPVRRRAHAHGNEMTTLFESQNKTILEFLGGLRNAKLFNAEALHVDAFRTHLAKTRFSVIEFMKVTTTGSFVFQVGAAAIAALFVYLSVEVFDLDIPRLVVLLVIFMRLVPRFDALQQATSTLLTSLPGFRNYQTAVRRFAAEQEEVGDATEIPLRLTDAVRVSDASVVFDGAEQAALDGVSLTLERGSMTGLIGPSGSGKSTLADLIAGLTFPTSGSVVVDGQTLDHANRRAWRARVATVAQDVFLMNDTVAANLRVGNPAASDAMLWAALRKARIADLIRSLPDGLDALAGERGSRFSGGERQRIALARALLAEPDLLILDEATSALDFENQRAIAAAIADLRGQLTCLIIAHRGSLVHLAEDVVALERGRIVETGSLRALSAKEDSYVARLLQGDEAQA